MNAKTLLEYQWPYLLTFFPPQSELDASAFRTGALKRKRLIDSASTLLRLILVYGFCGLSLRDTAAWAEASGLASISDVALLKRLRHAAPWMGHLLAIKLAERAPPPSLRASELNLRLVDATTISQPGSTGTDWRVHLGFNLRALAIDHVELTDSSGGETLTRFQFAPGDVVLGDRGYAHRRGIYSVHRQGGDFIVRLNWQTVPLQHRDGRPVDLVTLLRNLPEVQANSFALQIAPDPRARIPALPVRLAAIRKTEAAAEEGRKRILKQSSKKGKTPDPRTLEAAGYIFVATSLAEDQASAEQVLELYRFRWQIELAFKRMKGLLELGVLPAKEPRLARTIIYSKLLAALLLDDFTERFLSISPWGYRLS
jgi:hypothetical protein